MRVFLVLQSPTCVRACPGPLGVLEKLDGQFGEGVRTIVTGDDGLTFSAAKGGPGCVVERAGGLARIVLAHPPANALSASLLGELLGTLEALEADEECRVIVLAGSGDLFSTGLDWREIGAHHGDADGGREAFAAIAGRLCALMLAIRRHPCPVVAEVTGLASDAGCELVAASDLAIAAENAEFQTPGVQLGLMASPAMVALSRTVGPKHAMEMLLTGERIDARTAREFGLVNRVVPPEYLGTVVGKYATALAARSRRTLGAGKRSFLAQSGEDLAAAYAAASHALVEGLCSAEARERVAALLADRREAEA